MKKPKWLMKSPFSDVSDRLWTEAWDYTNCALAELGIEREATEEEILTSVDSINESMEQERKDNRYGAVE